MIFRRREQSTAPAGRTYAYVVRTMALLGAAILGQVINFGGTLLNARLYGPADVGLFGLFSAVWAFAFLAASWRYELAIVTAHDDGEAQDVAMLVVAMGLASAILAAIALALTGMTVGVAGIGRLGPMLDAMPPALVLAGVIQAGVNLCVRRRQFGRVAVQQVVLAAATVAAQILLAESDVATGGLVAGFIIGQVAAAAIVGGPLFGAIVGCCRLPNVLARLRRVAHEHRGHFLYTVPYSAITQLYYQAPVFLLGSLMTTQDVGFFNLAYRTTTMPLALVPSAVAQVIFPEMAEDRGRLEIWEKRLLALLAGLGVILAPAAALVLVFGPELYGFVLGDSWREAGVMARILVLASLMNGIASGYDRLYFVLQQQRAALILTCLIALVSVTSMLLSYLTGGSSQWLVGAWAACHVVMAVAWTTTVYRLAGFSLRALAARWVSVILVFFALTGALVAAEMAWHGSLPAGVAAAIIVLLYVLMAWTTVMPLAALLGRSGRQGADT